MKTWEPTIGKWDDEENYTIIEPAWKRALAFARDQYNAANVFLEYKDGLEKRSISYFEFTQKVLSVLVNEINRKDDITLCVAALCRLAEKTGITPEEIKQQCPFCDLDMLREFVCSDFTAINVYLERVINSNISYIVKEVVLTEVLCYLRLENCPREDWEKDMEYYSLIEGVLDAFGDSYGLLTTKIREQISLNKIISRNRNKTAEELFGGWDAE